MKVAYEVTLDKMVKNCDKMVIEELIWKDIIWRI
jgi:hypothetical protein